MIRVLLFCLLLEVRSGARRLKWTRRLISAWVWLQLLALQVQGALWR